MWLLILYDYYKRKSSVLEFKQSYYNALQYMELYAQNYIWELQGYTNENLFFNKNEYPIKKHIGKGIFYIEKQGLNYDKLIVKFMTKQYGIFYNSFNFDKCISLQLSYYDASNNLIDDRFFNNYFEYHELYFNTVIMELKQKFNENLFITYDNTE
jgi:hypothetical protein